MKSPIRWMMLVKIIWSNIETYSFPALREVEEESSKEIQKLRL